MTTAQDGIDALAAKTTNGKCPFCGSDNWHTMGADVNGSLSLVQALREVPGTGIAAFTLTCETCGFVRQHHVEALGMDGLPERGL